MSGGGGGRPPQPKAGAGKQRGCATQRRVTCCPSHCRSETNSDESGVSPGSEYLQRNPVGPGVGGLKNPHPHPSWLPRLRTGPSCARGCRAGIPGTSCAGEPLCRKPEWREPQQGDRWAGFLGLISLPPSTSSASQSHVPGGPLRRSSLEQVRAEARFARQQAAQGQAQCQRSVLPEL